MNSGMFILMNGFFIAIENLFVLEKSWGSIWGNYIEYSLNKLSHREIHEL